MDECDEGKLSEGQNVDSRHLTKSITKTVARDECSFILPMLVEFPTTLACLCGFRFHPLDFFTNAYGYPPQMHLNKLRLQHVLDVERISKYS